MTTPRQNLKQQMIAAVVGVFLLTAFSLWLYVSRLQEQLLDIEDQLRAADEKVYYRTEDLMDMASMLARERASNNITSAVVLTIHNAIDPELADIIVREAVKQGKVHNIHPLLVLALIKTESGFDPMAVSRAGAIGLMQIMKKHHPEKVSDEDLFHIGVNIRVGCHILSENLTVCKNNLPLALNRYLGRKAKGKDLVAYTTTVLKTFFELVIAHETLRQNYINS